MAAAAGVSLPHTHTRATQPPPTLRRLPLAVNSRLASGTSNTAQQLRPRHRLPILRGWVAAANFRSAANSRSGRVALSAPRPLRELAAKPAGSLGPGEAQAAAAEMAAATRSRNRCYHRQSHVPARIQPSTPPRSVP